MFLLEALLLDSLELPQIVLLVELLLQKLFNLDLLLLNRLDFIFPSLELLVQLFYGGL